MKFLLFSTGKLNTLEFSFNSSKGKCPGYDYLLVVTSPCEY